MVLKKDLKSLSLNDYRCINWVILKKLKEKGKRKETSMYVVKWWLPEDGGGGLEKSDGV